MARCASWRDPVLVHEAHHPHGEALGGRDEPVGEGQRRLAETPWRRAAPRRSAGTGPGPARGRRRRSPRCRPPPPPRRWPPPREPPPPPPPHCMFGEAERGQAQRGGDTRGVVAVVAVGGESVHLPGIEAGVGAGLEDGLQRQLELGVRSLPVLVVGRLAHPGDGGLGPRATGPSCAANSRTMRATRSGCSTCGACPAPSTVCEPRAGRGAA